MRSRASSKHGSRSMEMERPHLSGAYIRSLVKQLSSSTPKQPMNPKSPDGSSREGFIISETQQQQQQQQQQPKKQVRRRLHTSRPYQERLLNMAEARREIVTALKLHRASMKQQQQQAPQVSSPPPLEEPRREMRTCRENPCNYFSNPSFPSVSSYPPPLSWDYTSIAPQPIPENLILTLPSTPLGLNLNFHGFNLDSTTFCNNNGNPSIPSSSSCSYPYSSLPPPPPAATTTTTITMSVTGDPLISNGHPEASDGIAGALHPAMGDEEMAEIRLIGERHGVEWNDMLNLVTSAWWSKFLEAMEMTPHGQEAGIGDGGGEEGGDGLHHLFDEVMDIPAWLCDQQQLDEYCTEDYLQDAALPCLDIGEIEGMDFEWLS